MTPEYRPPADSAIRMCCRLFDAFGKGPADQGVECPMLSLSTSLPTKIVEKAAAPARLETGREAAVRARGHAGGPRESSATARGRRRL
ncbi:putative a part of riboflavin biosynthesis protein RibD [Burkholderia pseudomallei TSV44]|nr:putative a part of riboflavin biosynthesis protein RibD [Burkholderia pseudomallei TSV44]